MKKNGKGHFAKVIRLLKTFFAILIILVASGILFFIAYLHRTDPPLSVFYLSIASSLLCIAIIALTYEIINRRQTEIFLYELLNTALDRQDLRILSKISVFLFKESNRIQEIVSVDHQSHLLKTIIGIRCGNQSMADEIVDGFVNKVFTFPKTWRNRRHRIVLNELPQEKYSQEICNSYYSLTLEMKYQYELDRVFFQFGYVSDRDKFEELVGKFDFEYIYLLSSPELSDKIDNPIFSVSKVEINGISLIASSPQKKKDSLLINYRNKSLNNMLGREVSVHYIISTFILKRNHKFFDQILFPTKNSSTIFEFSGTKIHSVSVREFYVSAQQAKVRYFPPSVPKSVEVSIDDWVFPESGQIFVWNYPEDKYHW